MKIITTISGDREYQVVCSYCGAEYQLSISAVVVEKMDVEERVRTLVTCAIDGNPRESAEPRMIFVRSLREYRAWRSMPSQPRCMVTR